MAIFGLRYGLRYGARYGALAGIVLPIGPAGTVLPWNVEAFTWTLGWRTQIIKHRDGSETRQCLNDYPRESFSAEMLLSTADARYLRTLIRTYPASVFHLPVRPLDVHVTATVTADVITCDTALCDWAVEGQRVMLESIDGDTHASYLLSVGVSTVTIFDAVAFDFPAGSRLIPLTPVYLDDRAGSGYYPVEAGRWSLSARAIVPLTTLGIGGTAPLEYASEYLLESAPAVAGTQSETIDGGVDLLDVGGTIAASTTFTIADVQRGAAYTSGTEAERQTWLLLLATLRGQQVRFWHATYREDFDVVAVADSLITVDGEGDGDYLDAWAAALVGTHVRLETDDGEIRYLEITGATVDGDEVDLDVDGDDPDLTGLVVRLLSRLELVRLAAADVPLRDDGAGTLSIDLPTIAVQQ